MTNKCPPLLKAVSPDSGQSGFYFGSANLGNTEAIEALRTQLRNRSAQSGVACELLWLRSSHGLLWSGAPHYNRDSQTALRTQQAL